MSSTYVENLIRTVIDESLADNFKEAVEEWDIIDCEVDENCSSRCICGKESIKYLFRIKNRFTKAELFPIGSRCIQKFERRDLNIQVTTYEKLGKLYEAIRNNQYIKLNSEYFSRNLLATLYSLGAFEDNEFNGYNAMNDFRFLRDMFNLRKEPTQKQQRKISGLIAYQIKPFIQDLMHYRD